MIHAQCTNRMLEQHENKHNVFGHKQKAGHPQRTATVLQAAVLKSDLLICHADLYHLNSVNLIRDVS